MADELDKFVLEYKVELKNSLSLLQRLQQAMGKTQEASETSKKGLSEFASGAADEIGKLVPGLDKVTTAVRAMGAEFALAATAVLAVGAAVKSVMDVSQQYEAQRKAGQSSGVGTIRMEEYRRKFQRYGNGRVTNETAQDTVQKISDLGMKAYMDPTRMSAAEAKQLRLLGIQIGKGRNGITSTNQLIGALGERFATMKPAEVQGVAANLGINRDAALALARMGKSAGSITEMSKQDIESRINAQDNVTEMNVALAKLKEGFKETEQVIAEKLLPVFTKLVDVIARIVGMMPGATRATADVVAGKGLDAKAHPYLATLIAALPFGGNLLQGDKPKIDPAKTAATQAGAAKTLADAAKKQEAAANKADNREDLVKQYDEAFNEQSRDTEGQFGLAVNMFAGAVASFSNAIDERQAWAAWAGEIGRAAGLSGAGPAATRGTPSDEGRVDKVVTDYNRAAERQYEDIFARATREFHLPEGLLKSQGRVESGMNPKAVSEQGAQGLMQILPATQKSLGITDPFDPEQSIFGAAKLMRENLDRYGDVNQAIMAYHGGTDETNWGPKTRAYLAKVNSGMRGDSTPMKPAGGESRDKMMLAMVQNNIANRLGVGVRQIQTGGVNRGDVEFASSQLEGGIQNNIIQLQKQLDYIGLPQQVRSKIMTDIRDQQRGLSMMQNYAPQVAERAQPGDRSITIGERAIVINIDGAADPQKMGEQVQGHLMDHINDIANGMADGMKY